jgi:HD-like signal output (HDOD) protein
LQTLSVYTQRAVAMPAMPEIAQKLLRSFDRDDVSLGELSDLVGCDPALAGKVLRLANSARFAPSRQVGTVKDAAAMLGLSVLRDLAMSACMTGALPAPAHLDRVGFWRATLAVAGFAQCLARAMQQDEDVAYIGGLMLRSGQLLMTMVDPEAALAVARQAKEPDSRIPWEASMVGCTHPQVTAALARHWKFPAALTAAFDVVTDPMAARPFNRLGAVLRLASVAADAGAAGLPMAATLEELQAPLLRHLQLDTEWLASSLPAYADLTAGVDSLLH